MLARVAGIKVKQLRNYNPELRQSATPTDNPYLLKLPNGKKDQFLARWNSIPESERFAPQFIVHRVRNGESLWTISKKYGASIHDIAAVNKLYVLVADYATHCETNSRQVLLYEADCATDGANKSALLCLVQSHFTP